MEKSLRHFLNYCELFRKLCRWIFLRKIHSGVEASVNINSENALAPIESWGDGSQNCFQNMRIVGNTQLVWDGQQ
jgi:hypothetical protein